MIELTSTVNQHSTTLNSPKSFPAFFGMQIRLYLFLASDQATTLVRDGFPDTDRRYRLQPEEYTACSAFNPKSLVEVVLELNRETLERYRQELQMPAEQEFEDEDGVGNPTAEPIYWYEFPASVLRETCRSSRIIGQKRV